MDADLAAFEQQLAAEKAERKAAKRAAAGKKEKKAHKKDKKHKRSSSPVRVAVESGGAAVAKRLREDPEPEGDWLAGLASAETSADRHNSVRDYVCRCGGGR